MSVVRRHCERSEAIHFGGLRRWHGLLRLRLAMTRWAPSRGAAASRARIRRHSEGRYRRGACGSNGRTPRSALLRGLRGDVRDLRGAGRRARRRGCFFRLDQDSLRRHLRIHWPEDHQRRRPEAGPGGPYPPGHGVGAGLASSLAMTRNRPLDVRPRPHLDRRAAAVIASAAKQSIL